MAHVVRRVTPMHTKDCREPKVIHLTMDQPPQYFVRESHRRFLGWSYLMQLQGRARTLQAKNHRPSYELGK
jgi:hypothetical protein